MLPAGAGCREPGSQSATHPPVHQPPTQAWVPHCARSTQAAGSSQAGPAHNQPSKPAVNAHGATYYVQNTTRASSPPASHIKHQQGCCSALLPLPCPALPCCCPSVSHLPFLACSATCCACLKSFIMWKKGVSSVNMKLRSMTLDRSLGGGEGEGGWVGGWAAGVRHRLEGCAYGSHGRKRVQCWDRDQVTR
jgi:hypothetical protein